MESVVQSYFPVLVFFAIACGLSFIMIMVPFIIAKLKPDAEKLSPYECGFEPFDDARRRFDGRVRERARRPEDGDDIEAA